MNEGEPSRAPRQDFCRLFNNSYLTAYTPGLKYASNNNAQSDPLKDNKLPMTPIDVADINDIYDPDLTAQDIIEAINKAQNKQ